MSDNVVPIRPEPRSLTGEVNDTINLAVKAFDDTVAAVKARHGFISKKTLLEMQSAYHRMADLARMVQP